MPPELGKTAAEIMGALGPLLQQNSDNLGQQTKEISRLADQVTEINGTVRGLCEWRSTINERHRKEDTETPPADPPAKGFDTVAILNLVLGWVFRFLLAGAALAAGINLAKLAELLPK